MIKGEAGLQGVSGDKGDKGDRGLDGFKGEPSNCPPPNFTAGFKGI